MPANIAPLVFAAKELSLGMDFPFSYNLRQVFNKSVKHKCRDKNYLMTEILMLRPNNFHLIT